MQDRIFRPVAVEDLEGHNYGPDNFYEGCGRGLYRKANCREATDSDDTGDEDADKDAGGDPEDVPLEVTLPPPQLRSAATRAEELYWAGGTTATATAAATTATTSEASDSGDLLLDLAAALSGLESEEDRPPVSLEANVEEPQGLKAEGNEEPQAEETRRPTVTTIGPTGQQRHAEPQAEEPSSPAINPTGPIRQQRRNKKRWDRHRTDKRRRKQAREPEYLVLDSVEASDDEAPPPTGKQDPVAPSLPSSPQAEGDGFYSPVCRRRVSVRARRHIEVNHLPWWIAPDRACWTCRL